MNKNNEITGEYLVKRMEQYRDFLKADLPNTSKKQLEMLKEIQLLLKKFRKLNE